MASVGSGSRRGGGKRVAEPVAEPVEQAEQTGGVAVEENPTMFVAPDQLILDENWSRFRAVAEENDVDSDKPVLDKDAPDDTQGVVSIKTLARSIKEKGQLEDVLICEINGDLHVVAGHGRTRAIALLAKDDPSVTVRCRVLKELSGKPIEEIKQAAFLINEEENLQRNNLTLLDKASCMKREFAIPIIGDDGKPRERTKVDIAKKWNCTSAAVGQALKLINSPQPVLDRVYNGAIPGSVVIKVLTGISPEGLVKIAEDAQKAHDADATFTREKFKELARTYQQTHPEVIEEEKETPATPTGDGTTAPTTTTNGATAGGMTPVRKKKKAGRKPAAEKAVRREANDLRKVLQGRGDVLSVTLLNFLNGDKFTDEVRLVNVLDGYKTAAEKGGGVTFPDQPATNPVSDPGEADDDDEAEEGDEV